MTDITINTDNAQSVIHCGEGAFDKYAPALRERQLFIVTDTNVFSLYKDLIYQTFGKDVPVKVIPAGEASKNSRCLLNIISAMADAGIKRNGCVVALGGGVVGDIAGLCASLYMRGVHLVQIPTTLLSQVDSSVGGKTAVDFGKIKNLIGTFYQPEEVIVDPRFITTLSKRQIRCGLGEIIKHGALDKTVYSKLIKAEDLFDIGFLANIIPDNIRFKASVVTRDEREAGLRKILNLGHTTGHAFELYYGRRSHGEYVLIGMYYELFIAREMGICGGEYCDSLISLIKKVVKNIPGYDDIQSSALGAKYDKKNSSAKITIVVPHTEGQSRELLLDMDEYIELLTKCRDNL
ncbi:MAG: 3-dehydroquinate synthase [Clostridia bacterium]|nr:3-dehydroquinate synthase [Clostridia bacterium]